MKVVNIFLKNPTSGWNPFDCSKFNKDYRFTDEFAEDFCLNNGTSFMLVKKEVDCRNGALIVRLELKSQYSINHPDSNQAHYFVEAVMVNLY